MDQVTPLFAGSLFTVATILGTVWANCTVDAGAVTATEIARTVIVAEEDAAASATEVAVIVTCKSEGGGVDGAVYVVAAPLAVVVGEIFPQGAGEHDTLQLTPLLLGSLVTVATIFGTTEPACTDEIGTVTEIMIEGTVIVTVADFVASARDVAVTVTVRSLAGAVVGAL